MGRESERKIPAQRRTEIRALLGRRGGASIAEIADALGVSGSTVRRDLDELDREGAVRGRHGGGWGGRVGRRARRSRARWASRDRPCAGTWTSWTGRGRCGGPTAA